VQTRLTHRWAPIMALLLVGAACGGADQSTRTVDPTAESTPTPASTTTPPSLPSPSSPSTAPAPTEPQEMPVSSETVTDPVGDVAVTRIGDYPDDDPRADLVSYTVSWTDVVRFSLTTVEIDPARLEDVAVGFHTGALAESPPTIGDRAPERSEVPEFVATMVFGDDGLYQLQEYYTLICPVRRSIEEGSYVVEFDAACLSDTELMRIASPITWWHSVGDVPTGAPNMCGVPNPPPECPPYATYTDEMPGSGLLGRSP
jgi:hypothetical protein